MKEVPPFARSLNGPVKVAPAWRTIVSPGLAASIAACRLPPAPTVIVAALPARASSTTAPRHRPIARMDLTNRDSFGFRETDVPACRASDQPHGWAATFRPVSCGCLFDAASDRRRITDLFGR